eukprot:GEMP01005807.1.p1 GENE.GEMP01005807.1~~GEMP01005807.1.p1  ORF type:complete len:911 (+),score=257.27 GEMP01005807.1:44-2776(+)
MNVMSSPLTTFSTPEHDARSRGLRQVADEYRRKLYLLVEEPYSALGMDRIRDAVKQFDHEIRNIPEDRMNPQAYGVLRQSLRESQRRNEVLHQDMIRHQHANEELVNTLTTLKDSNKRLLDQVRKQTDEIALLTQLRVEDEQKMDKMQRTFNLTEEQLAKDSQRRIAALQSAADDRYHQLQVQHQDKTRIFHMRLGIMKQDMSDLRKSADDQKREMVSCMEQMRLNLQQCNAEMQQRVDAMAEQFKTDIAQVQMQAHAHEKRYIQEKEMRQREVVAWSHRHATLQSEKEALEATTHRQLTHYIEQVRRLEGQIEQERDTLAIVQRKSVQDERELERTRQDWDIEKRLREQQNQEHVQSILKLEETIRENEIRETELKGKLADAHEQFSRHKGETEQRERRSQMDADEMKDLFERKLISKDNDLRCMEATVKKERQNSVESSEHHAMTLHKVQSEHSQNLSHAVEEARQKEDHLMAQLVQSQTRIEENQRAADDLKAECFRARSSIVDTTGHLNRVKSENERKERENDILKGECEDLRRASFAREHELLSRQQLLEECVLKEEEKVESANLQLATAQDSLLRAKDDFARIQLQSQEGQAATINTYEIQLRTLKEEVQQTEHAFQLERQEVLTQKEQYDLWYDKHQRLTRTQQDEVGRQLLSLEAEKMHREEQLKSNLAKATSELAQAQQKVETQNGEMFRSRALLSETQANLTWVKAEKERDEREIERLRKRHDDECRLLTDSLEKTRAEQLNEKRKSGAILQYCESEKTRYREEVDAARTDTYTKSRAEASRQLENTKKEYSSYMQQTESRFYDELSREKSKVDSVVKENDRLKDYIGEHRSASQGLSQLHTDLESHLRRLERHADDLRVDLSQKAESGWSESPPRLTPKQSPIYLAPNPSTPIIMPPKV